jgi:fructosamine-3-kinase
MEAVQEILREALGEDALLRNAVPVGGGSINRTFRLTLTDGRTCFLKTHDDPPPGFFEAEAQGLRALAAATAGPAALRVPEMLAVGSSSSVPFLLLEAIATGPARAHSSETLGRGLAHLHQAGRGGRYGFEADNYLGLTPQPNAWEEEWCTFWREHRLGHQMRLARRQGLSDPTLDRLADRLADRLDEWLKDRSAEDEPPCLIHGDLWGGNYLIDDRGDPVLIDPAVYYGRPEAELAMTRLFGGFDAHFYAAYREVQPLAPGSEERLAIYELYHLLNHLNLFGRGYRDRCLANLKRLV